MKSEDKMPNSHYELLLKAFDKTQAALERAVTNEKTAKHYFKTTSNDAKKKDRKILKLEYSRAKHRRKARKAAYKIAKLRLRQWAKTHSIDEKIYQLNDTTETNNKKQSTENKATTNVEKTQVTKIGRKVKLSKDSISPQSKYTVQTKESKVNETAEAVTIKDEAIVVPVKKNYKPRVKKTEEPVATPIVKVPRAKKVVEAKVEKAVKVPRAKKVVEAKVEKAVKVPRTKKVVEAKVEKAVKVPRVVKTKTANVQTESIKPTPQDLTLIEGIGPKINEWLQAAGITTFAILAATQNDTLKNILISRKNRIADPATWPEQAALAAEGKMAELEALQAQLKGGKR
jgi:predicted flap endonuclease-1-like 5' DNA nuclease